MFKTLLASLVLAAGLTSAAHAELRISFVDLDLGYNNTADNALFDAGTGGSTGGNGFPGEGDSALLVFSDETGILSSENGFLDFFLPVQPISSGGDVVSSGPGYFDVLLGPPANGYGLSVQDVIIAEGDLGAGNFVLIGSIGESTVSSLPYPGLEVGSPIRLSFSTQIIAGTLLTTGNTVDSFLANGTGEVSSYVPEPAAIALLGLGLVAFGFSRRRRQR